MTKNQKLQQLEEARKKALQKANELKAEMLKLERRQQSRKRTVVGTAVLAELEATPEIAPLIADILRKHAKPADLALFDFLDAENSDADESEKEETAGYQEVQENVLDSFAVAAE